MLLKFLGVQDGLCRGQMGRREWGGCCSEVRQDVVEVVEVFRRVCVGVRCEEMSVLGVAAFRKGVCRCQI